MARIEDIAIDEPEDEAAPAPKAPKRVSSAAVRQLIAKTEAQLETLKVRRGEIVLEQCLGAASADAQLAEVLGHIADAELWLANLTAGLAAAIDGEQQVDRRRSRSLLDTQRRAALYQTSQLCKAGARLTTALEQATEAYRDMLALGDKTRAVCVAALGATSVVDTATTTLSLRVAVERELWRLGGDDAIPAARDFPGGAFGRFEHQHDHARTPGLTEKLAADRVYLLGQFDKLLARHDAEAG